MKKHRSSLIVIMIGLLAAALLVAVVGAPDLARAADPAPFTMDRTPSHMDVSQATGAIGYTANKTFQIQCPESFCDYGIVEVYAGATISETAQNLVLTLQSSPDGVTWASHTEAITLTGDPPPNGYVQSMWRGQFMRVSAAVGSTGRYTPTLDVVFSNR